MATNLPVVYLTDSKTNQIIAPQCGPEAIMWDDIGGISDIIYDREIFLFHGYSNVSNPVLNQFIVQDIQDVNYQLMDDMLQSDGSFKDTYSSTYAGAYSASYEVTVRFIATRLMGAQSSRQIGFGLSINGDSGDNTIYWGTQVYDRFASSFKWIISDVNPSSTKLKFKYYCEAGYNFSLGIFEIWVKRLNYKEAGYSLSPVKYLTDKQNNNQKIVPVTSTDAVRYLYNSRNGTTTNITNVAHNYPAGVAIAHYNQTIFNSASTEQFWNSSAHTYNLTGQSSNAWIDGGNSSWTPLPKIRFRHAGWYEFTISGRLEDGSIKNHYTSDMWVQLDHLNENNVAIKTEPFYQMRYYDRRGFNGSIVTALPDNATVAIAIGSDGAFDTIQYIDLMIELVKKD